MQLREDKRVMSAKLSAKDFLRSLFSDGRRHTMEEILNGGMYKEATMRTAITDLKNPKYSSGPLLFIENDGQFFFTKTDSDVVPEYADTATDEPGSLVDQVPEGMSVSKGLAAWIEDGAGLVLGAFDVSFEINDEQDKMIASIELEGTPSTFTEGGRRLTISSGDGDADVAVEAEEDGRFVRLFIEAVEHGFAHAFSYPAIEIPQARRVQAFELANEINRNSKFASIYFFEPEGILVPCIKSSSTSEGQTGSFESTCYSALETTFHYWASLQALEIR